MTPDRSRSNDLQLDRRSTVKWSGLLAVGSLVGLAGCNDEGPGDPDEEPVGEDPAGEEGGDPAGEEGGEPAGEEGA